MGQQLQLTSLAPGHLLRPHVEPPLNSLSGVGWVESQPSLPAISSGLVEKWVCLDQFRRGYSFAAKLTQTSSLSLRTKTHRLANAGWLQTTRSPPVRTVGSST